MAHKDDPSKELRKDITLTLKMEDDPEHQSDYGKGNNAFIGEVEGPAVAKILQKHGYEKNPKQYRGHVNFINKKTGHRAQLGREGRKTTVTFWAKPKGIKESMRFKKFILERRKPQKVMPSGKYGKFDKEGNYFLFKDYKTTEDFIARMGVDQTPAVDFVDGQSGEILMQVGETKRVALKKRGKQKVMQKYEDALEGVLLMSYSGRGYWEDEGDFDRFYNIIKVDMEKYVDDPQMMYDADYDVSVSFPSKIKRKDGRPFSWMDIHNIDAYIAMWEFQNGGGNIKLNGSYKEGARIAQFDPMFT